jgi:hypothetical protein
MDESLKFGAPLIFRTPFWVTLISDTDVRVKLRPLSYREVVSLQELSYITNKLTTIKSYDETHDLLSNSIVQIDNATNFPDFNSFVKQLPVPDVVHLLTQLYNISTLTNTQSENLKDLFDIFFEPKLQDDNWDCDACIHKKLQGFRACAFIPEEQRVKDFTYKVNNKLYTQCPKSIMDQFVINQAYQGYQALKSGVLPEAGGTGDQTLWFVRASTQMLSRFAAIEAKNKIL